MTTSNNRTPKAVQEEVESTTDLVTLTPTEKPVRHKKGAFNGTRGKLQVGKPIEGYHLYFFNDEPGRIATALEAGWEFVSPDEVGYQSSNVTNNNVDLGNRVSVLGMKSELGHPQQQILLKIRQEWWEEDQAEIQARNNKTEASIKRGKGGNNVDTTGFYDAGIKSTTSNKF
jgi:hypothetical protein